MGLSRRGQGTTLAISACSRSFLSAKSAERREIAWKRLRRDWAEPEAPRRSKDAVRRFSEFEPDGDTLGARSSRGFAARQSETLSPVASRFAAFPGRDFQSIKSLRECVRSSRPLVAERTGREGFEPRPLAPSGRSWSTSNPDPVRSSRGSEQASLALGTARRWFGMERAERDLNRVETFLLARFARYAGCVSPGSNPPLPVHSTVRSAHRLVARAERDLNPRPSG